jgi:hypothetical protein
MTMNTRKTVLATLITALIAAPLIAAPVHAQYQGQTQAQQQYPGQPQAPQRIYTQAELDQMLAPIALYPDALLSQILMAATYPIEVVQAARWSRANPGLTGENAVRAVQNEDWDPSVKSLVAFPQVLQRMDERLDWTRSLGDAFLAQEAQVMDQVQQLRQRAQAAGNLRSDERIRVEQQGPAIVVQPASPQYVYVPYYDPMVVYGPWMWPAYQPVVWAPWPGYARPYRPGVSVGFWWGGPVSLSLNFLFSDFDWGHRHVRVSHRHSHYDRPHGFGGRNAAAVPARWQHDPHHRRGVAYRNDEVRQRFVNAQPQRREAARDERQEPRQEQRQEQRREQRPDRRDDRRTEVQPRPPVETRVERREERPAARVQARPNVETRVERREEQRVERREEQRVERREERPAARVQAQPLPRQAEQRANMPAAKAPQTPRVERQAERQERQEQRQERREQRQERGHKVS